MNTRYAMPKNHMQITNGDQIRNAILCNNKCVSKNSVILFSISSSPCSTQHKAVYKFCN